MAKMTIDNYTATRIIDVTHSASYLLGCVRGRIDAGDIMGAACEMSAVISQLSEVQLHVMLDLKALDRL